MSYNLGISKLLHNKQEQLSVIRITALWAFSESAFGGILHTLRVPLRGLFISSAAVLFISLIASLSQNRREILKSTIIVVLIKAIVSPYSPFTAYLAVSLQGILGFIFFPSKRFYRLSSFLLGFFVLLFTGLQKLVILAILFGITLLDSLNLFINQIASEIFKIDHPDINFGYLLIVIYVGLHIIAGIFIGLYAGRLPIKIAHYKNILSSFHKKKNIEEIIEYKKGKRNKWFLRPTGIIIICISLGVIIFSYTSPAVESNVVISILAMLGRALAFTFIWYVLLSPFIKKLLRKFTTKNKLRYANEVEEIISLFPHFNNTVGYIWDDSKKYSGYQRIKYFLSTSFYYLLLSN